MKMRHKIMYAMMKSFAPAAFLIPGYLAHQSGIEWYWQAAILFFAFCYYSELDGIGGPIATWRAKKEMEFDASNKERIEPYFSDAWSE